MSKERLTYLWELYLNNKISPSECKELLAYIAIADEEMLEVIDHSQRHQLNDLILSEKQADKIFGRILEDKRLVKTTKNVRLNLTFVKYAAAIVIITSCIGIYLFKAQKGVSTSVNFAKNAPINADEQSIRLKTSKGAELALDSAGGYLSLLDNQIAVIDSRGTAHQILADNETKVQQLVLQVPKGATYQIKLPDGSNVWLNSASSLSFPSRFSDLERVVQLDGEAYFEVAKHATKKFKVISNENVVEVLGTHFNISAYKGDDDIITTLVEGSVRVAFSNNQRLLKPGEQALSNVRKHTIFTQLANVSSVLAWKSGYFDFQDADLQTIMEQIERWYDVDVSYQGAIAPIKFGGTFSKSKSLDELLDHLETLGKLRFKREGRRLIVTS